MIEHRRYVSSSALGARDLFIGFNWKKYLRENELVSQESWMQVCAQVFRYAFNLIVRDIIENKTEFKMPPQTGGRLYMRAISGEDFIHAKQCGAFEEIDYLASNFTAYMICLGITVKHRKWQRNIYLSSTYRQKLIDLTNQGESW